MIAKSLLVSLLLVVSTASLMQSAKATNNAHLIVPIRATFIMHIVNYSRWNTSYGKQNFCVLEHQNGSYFKELLKDDFVENAKISLDVVQLSSISDARSNQCHYLFIDEASESEDVYRQLASTTEHMVTIGETVKFIKEGGLMSLVSEADRIKIYISKDKYETSKVKFSARLLKFANFVG